jgi:hypothetical protein
VNYDGRFDNHNTFIYFDSPNLGLQRLIYIHFLVFTSYNQSAPPQVNNRVHTRFDETTYIGAYSEGWVEASQRPAELHDNVAYDIMVVGVRA